MRTADSWRLRSNRLAFRGDNHLREHSPFVFLGLQPLHAQLPIPPLLL